MKIFLIFIFTVSIVFSIFYADMCAAKNIDAHIYILPSGSVDRKVLEYIKDRLPGSLPIVVRVEIDSPEAPPEAAYDPSRKQYNARLTLDGIFSRTIVDVLTERLLVITDTDLYMPEADYVFGLADEKKGICIVSLARLKNEFYNAAPDSKLFLKRAFKESLHELCHSWGLSRCVNKKCVMFFSNNIQEIDNKKDELCHDCRNALQRRRNASIFGKISIL